MAIAAYHDAHIVSGYQIEYAEVNGANNEQWLRTAVEGLIQERMEIFALIYFIHF